MNKQQLTKMLKGAAWAALVAALTYTLAFADLIDVDLSSPLIYALLAAVLNAAKLLAKPPTP